MIIVYYYTLFEITTYGLTLQLEYIFSLLIYVFINFKFAFLKRNEYQISFHPNISQVGIRIIVRLAFLNQIRIGCSRFSIVGLNK